MTCLPNPRRVAFAEVSLDGDNQVARALTICQLAEHHHQNLIPAGEVFCIITSTILGYNSVEFAPVKKCSYVSINLFVLIHVWAISYIDTNSNPFSRKSASNN